LATDIRNFLETRAYWSPAAYNSLDAKEQSSLPVNHFSDPLLLVGAGTPTTLPSRSARYQYMELLSQDAAHYSTRLNALKQEKMSVSAQTLDKLIDYSRHPVPEECLDRQEALENKYNLEMGNIGHFLLTVVKQWKT
jgi:hypothetical protein